MRANLTIFAIFAASCVTLTSCNFGGATRVEEIVLGEILPDSLREFRKDIGRYPTQSEGLAVLVDLPKELKEKWNGPYIEVIPNDPWGNPWVYRTPSKKRGKSYDLICTGRDGIITDDDYIVSK